MCLVDMFFDRFTIEPEEETKRVSKDMPRITNGDYDLPIAKELRGLPIEYFCVDLDFFSGELIYNALEH